MGTKLVGDHLSRGTKFDGDHWSRGINFIGIISPGGQEVGDQKSMDQMRQSRILSMRSVVK